MRKAALILAAAGMLFGSNPVQAAPIDPGKRQCAVTYLTMMALVGFMGGQRKDLTQEQRDAYGTVSRQFFALADELLGKPAEVPKDVTDEAGARMADVMGDNEKARTLVQDVTDCFEKYNQNVDLGILGT